MLANGLSDILPEWMDPEYLIEWFGSWALWGIAAVIIIETGFLFPFLPGDSLLFTAGVFTATGAIPYSIGAVLTVTGLAALLGPQIGYWLGRSIGPKIFQRPDSRFFKKAYIDKTHAFFDKYGGRAIVLGQFVPFVRTYIPVAAGVGKMPYRRFAMFNIMGAAVWGVGVTALGYALGNIPAVRDNFEVAIYLIIAVSVSPIVFEFIKHRVERRRERNAAAADVDATSAV